MHGVKSNKNISTGIKSSTTFVISIFVFDQLPINKITAFVMAKIPQASTNHRYW